MNYEIQKKGLMRSPKPITLGELFVSGIRVFRKSNFDNSGTFLAEVEVIVHKRKAILGLRDMGDDSLMLIPDLHFCSETGWFPV